jgi:hypothetical protein
MLGTMQVCITSGYELRDVIPLDTRCSKWNESGTQVLAFQVKWNWSTGIGIPLHSVPRRAAPRLWIDCNTPLEWNTLVEFDRGGLVELICSGKRVRT